MIGGTQMDTFDPGSLRRAQKEARLLGKDLAAKAEITPDYLSHLRNADHPNPSPEVVDALATALGVTPEALHLPAGAKKALEPIIDLAPTEMALVAALRTLPGPMQAQMASHVIGMAAAVGEIPSGPQPREYWHRRARQLRDMLTEADRRHDEAVRQEGRGDQPPATPKP